MRTTQKFENNEEAILHSTGCSELDGLHVVVTGIAIDQYPTQIIYIIEKFTLAEFDNGYSCIAITSNCLGKIEE